MRRILSIALCMMMGVGAFSQRAAGYSAITTVYEKYQPAKITMKDGKVVMQDKANVFLKNARLLFKKGSWDMQADMSQIHSVEFADRYYLCVDTLLTTVVDTLGENKAVYATVVDIEAYKGKVANSRVISNLSLGGDQIAVTAYDKDEGAEDRYPLMRVYYLLIDGKVVPAHERTVSRMLPKDKRARLKFYLDMPDFDWCDKTYLHRVLQLFEK